MILIIDKSPKYGKRLSDMFYYMGILANYESPTDAFSEISTLYKAIIISSPEALSDPAFYIDRLRSYDRDIPIFALSMSKDKNFVSLFDYVFKPSTSPAQIYEYLTERYKRRAPGIYRLAGIDASASIPDAEYFNIPLRFTKSENMILKILIKSSPNPLSSKEILKYAFKKTRTPDLANIRTHISVMNKKFRSITERNLIALTPKEGYSILLPFEVKFVTPDFKEDNL